MPRHLAPSDLLFVLFAASLASVCFMLPSLFFKAPRRLPCLGKLAMPDRLNWMRERKMTDVSCTVPRSFFFLSSFLLRLQAKLDWNADLSNGGFFFIALLSSSCPCVRPFLILFYLILVDPLRIFLY